MSLYRVSLMGGEWVVIDHNNIAFAVCPTEHSAEQTAQSMNTLMGNWKPLIEPAKNENPV